MAKTYDPAQVATDETYQVRFLIGDTDVGTPPAGPVNNLILDDAEIDWLLSTEANVYMAAAAAADAIVRQLQQASASTGVIVGPIIRKRIGPTDVSYANGKTSVEYEKLADRLRQMGRAYQMPFAGGISVSDKQTRADDPDRPADGFRRGMFDSPDTDAGPTDLSS